VIAFTLIAIFAPLLEPYSVTQQTGRVYQPPSAQHWLGTDDGGVDVFSELIAGARVSMLVGFAGAAVAMIIGGLVGLISGFYGGKSDIFLMRITDYFLVIPDVPLMIVAAAIFGRSLTNIIIIIGVIYWTSTARLIRAQVKSVRERVYVKRARALGAGNRRLMTSHVLPQVTPLLVANTVLTIATAIFAETYISFLGLGDPSTISWGKMIQNSLDGGAIFYSAWWAIIPPGAMVTIIILASTMVGTSIEDALNPRLKVGHLSVRRFRMRPLVGRPGAD
jgi:peptide/nickel transport system permease protein